MMLSDRSQLVQGCDKGSNHNTIDCYAYKPISTSPENQNIDGETGAPPLLADEGSSKLVKPEARACSLRRECQGFCNIVCTWTNLLLVFVPLGIVSHRLRWSSAAIFSCNFAAIVPLAGILGAATESLAMHTGQMIGGLLNASFGNAVEMIVAVQAIRAGLISVVKGSLLGSILSNLLLVLGMSFFAAGVVQKETFFNAAGAATNTSCLVLGAVALALPTLYDFVPGTNDSDCLDISRISSVVIAVIYVLFIVFQLFTHASYFSSGDGEEEEEEAELSAVSSLLLLMASTCIVAYCSEFLVDSIEGVSEEYGMPKAFIGVILLPIVGNAAEHVTSVTVAAKGKMDLALGVAVGSSTQIILLVVPFAVIVGWVVDTPMTLDFRVFDATVLLLSVFLVSSVLNDGRSNWLEGVMLCATYVLIAVICWYIPDEHDEVRPLASRHHDL